VRIGRDVIELHAVAADDTLWRGEFFSSLRRGSAGRA
jgi:hypothetical protein